LEVRDSPFFEDFLANFLFLRSIGVLAVWKFS
jgi:hypothetical protein